MDGRGDETRTTDLVAPVIPIDPVVASMRRHPAGRKVDPATRRDPVDRERLAVVRDAG